MSGPRTLREDRDGFCTLTLNRPDKLNALDTRTFEELEGHLRALEGQTEAVGCVVLRGAGRGFCAGADLAALGVGSDGKPLDPAFKPGVIDRLAGLPQPVVAAVHGVCYTGGLELALACDFIVADASARFADTHGKWGLVGARGMGQRLRRRVGESAAKGLMMTGRTIGAREALKLGLIDRFVPAGALEAALADFTAAILANSWHTNLHVKRSMRETDGMSLAKALAHDRAHYPGSAPDHAERLANFARK